MSNISAIYVERCGSSEVVFLHKPVLSCYPLEVFLAIMVPFSCEAS